jgi:hypothetical protein
MKQMYKLIGFAHSSNEKQVAYIKQQLETIKLIHSDIIVEFQTEESPLITRYCDKPDRFPKYMILKNNIHMNHVNAKYSDNDLFNWLKLNLG